MPEDYSKIKVENIKGNIDLDVILRKPEYEDLIN